MVVQSPDGSKQEVPPKSSKDVKAGDVVITANGTYAVPKEGNLIVAEKQLVLPKASEVDQGSLINNIGAKISDFVADAISGWFQ